MIYSFSLTIPANTLEAVPTEQEIILTHGVINRVEVEFPAGCVGLVCLAVDRHEHQVWPLNPGGSFSSDDYVISFDEYYELLDPPYKLTLRGWSPGTGFAHTVKVRFGLLPESIARKIYGELSPVDRQAVSGDLLAALTGEVEG